jgi:hypothetical protein
LLLWPDGEPQEDEFRHTALIILPHVPLLFWWGWRADGNVKEAEVFVNITL